MKKRPLTVSIVGCLYIAAGAIGLVYHLREFRTSTPFQFEIVWISLLRLLAIVSGIFMLLGRSWARWLALAWITFHVVISFFHSWEQMAFHGLLLVLIAYFLYLPKARVYFSRGGDMGT
jgi:hypothetical protein